MITNTQLPAPFSLEAIKQSYVEHLNQMSVITEEQRTQLRNALNEVESIPYVPPGSFPLTEDRPNFKSATIKPDVDAIKQIDAVVVVQVVHVVGVRGKGTEVDVLRRFDQYWSLQGELLVDIDSLQDTSKQANGPVHVNTFEETDFPKEETENPNAIQ